MKKGVVSLWPIYVCIFLSVCILAYTGSRTITVLAENRPIKRDITFVIDPGHGGIDGGAVSCTGKAESHLNLQIAFRLRDLLHLLGFETVMTRTTDTSIHTEGKTISAQKLSDLKERVRIVNETENAILLSIHQNFYPDSRYSGAQIFYNSTEGAKELAYDLQNAMIETVNKGSHRASKPVDGIYLMEHIQRPGLLVECGFLSNPEEERKLQTSDYQKKLCCVIVATLAKALV